jgi:hypothetical protein
MPAKPENGEPGAVRGGRDHRQKIRPWSEGARGAKLAAGCASGGIGRRARFGFREIAISSRFIEAESPILRSKSGILRFGSDFPILKVAHAPNATLPRSNSTRFPRPFEAYRFPSDFSVSHWLWMNTEITRVPNPGKLQTLLNGSPFAGLPAGLASRVAYLLAFSKRVPDARETLLKLRIEHKLSRGHVGRIVEYRSPLGGWEQKSLGDGAEIDLPRPS